MVNYTSASLTASSDGQGGVGTIIIVDGGSGYSNPVLEFSLPQIGGTQAIATASLDGNGSITDVNLVYAGTGYFQEIQLFAFDLTGATQPIQSIAGWDASPTLGNAYHLVDSNNLYTLFNNKQNLLAYDNQPTSASSKSVTSGNIYSWVTGLVSTSSLTNLTYYANAGSSSISSILTQIGYSQANMIILSTGTHSTDTSLQLIAPSLTLVSLDGAGAQPAQISATITLAQGSNSSYVNTRNKFSNIQFTGTFSVVGTQGRHYWRCCSFTGFSTSGGTTNWLQFTDCDFSSGTCVIDSTFSGAVYFTRCNFNGSPTLSQASPLQVIFFNCTGLTSFTLNGTLYGLNTLSTGVSRNDSTLVYQNNVPVLTTGNVTTSIASGSSLVPTSGTVYSYLTGNYPTNTSLTSTLSSYVTSSSLTSTLTSYLTSSSAASLYQPVGSYLTTSAASASYQPLLSSSTNITVGSISCSSETDTGALSCVGFTSTGDTKITRIGETINNYGSISSNTITTSWTSGNIIYATPASSTNLSLVITSVPTTVNTSFNFSVLLDASTYKVYINALTLNGSAATLLYNGGSASIPTLTSAGAIIQSFNAIYTASGLWKVITSVIPYY